MMDIKSHSFPIAYDATVVGTSPDGTRMIFDLLKFDRNSAEDVMKDIKCGNCNCAA